MEAQIKKVGVVDATGLIVNVIVIAEGVTTPTPAGMSFVDITNVANCGIGWSYTNGQFVEPV